MGDPSYCIDLDGAVSNERERNEMCKEKVIGPITIGGSLSLLHRL